MTVVSVVGVVDVVSVFEAVDVVSVVVVVDVGVDVVNAYLHDGEDYHPLQRYHRLASF